MRLPPQPGLPPQVELHRCRLDDDRDIELAVAEESLAPAERARAARFLQPRDAARYIRGRGFVRRTLGACLSCPAARVDLRAQEGGKPCIFGAPLEFNLTHSADRAVLAVSPDRRLGVDLELRSGPARDWNRLLETGRMVFTSAETEVLAGLPGEARIERFLSFWTAKEARMKLTGEGMRMAPKGIVLRLVDGVPAGFQGDVPAVGLHRVETGIPEAVCHLVQAPVDCGES